MRGPERAALIALMVLMGVSSGISQARVAAGVQGGRAILRSTDDAAKILAAARQASGQLPRRVLAGIGPKERADFEHAYRAVAAPGGATNDARKRIIDRAIALAASPETWTKKLPLSARLPHVYVRSPVGAEIGSVLRSFAQARMDKVLRTPLRTNNIRVVTLNLADDADVAAAESARFRRLLPPRNLDRVGPIDRLAPEQAGNHADLAKAMQYYRGQTLILVGHVDRGRFSVRTATGTKSIDIESWLRASREAGVDLIPIGCNAEQLADVGTAGLLNSARVRTALLRVLSGDPRSMEEMLGLLTGPDLRLVIDPFGTRLFGQAAELTDDAGRSIGNMAANLGSFANRVSYNMPRTIDIASRDADYSTCFRAASAADFDACAARLLAAAQERAKQFRATCLIDLRDEEASARVALSQAGQTLVRALWLYGGAIALIFYLVRIWSKAREEEVANGPSLALLVGKDRIRDLADLRELPNGLLILAFLLIGATTLFGIAYLGDEALFMTLQSMIVFGALYGIVVLVLTAIAQGSLLKATLALSVVVLSGTSLYVHERVAAHAVAAFHHDIASDDLDEELGRKPTRFPKPCAMKAFAVTGMQESFRMPVPFLQARR